MTALTPAVETSLDPRTGEPVHTLPESTPFDVDVVVAAAFEAAPHVANTAPAVRANWLEAIAEAVLEHADELAAIADRETGLGRARLDGEVQRCAAQLRHYAVAARDGGFLDAVIDHAGAERPDIRRVRVPLGPVAVFGASNFPFGFGSLGNDTAAALAAGCPVVVKGHPAHLGTHARLLEIAVAALRAAGAPEGTLGGVTGFTAGTSLVVHPWIRAVAFTGSQQGGMALAGLAATRPVGIPVYAEMGTINPVVVTTAASQHRATTIGAGAAQSFTLGMGQFCTKPGLILVPQGSAVLDGIVEALVLHEPRGLMLTNRIAAAYAAGIDRLLAAGAQLVHVVPDPGTGSAVSSVVLAADPDLLVPGSPLLEECFGPVLVVAQYVDAAHRDAILARLQGCLVASVMSDGPSDPEIPALVASLTGLAGRVVVDGWPTGVATTWAQHHGGPWPSTTAPAATSVGAGALDRFTRPVAYQGFADGVLPPALAEANVWHIPRRVDGVVTAAPTGQLADAAATSTGSTAAPGTDGESADGKGSKAPRTSAKPGKKAASAKATKAPTSVTSTKGSATKTAKRGTAGTRAGRADAASAAPTATRKSTKRAVSAKAAGATASAAVPATTTRAGAGAGREQE